MKRLLATLAFVSVVSGGAGSPIAATAAGAEPPGSDPPAPSPLTHPNSPAPSPQTAPAPSPQTVPVASPKDSSTTPSAEKTEPPTTEADRAILAISAEALDLYIKFFPARATTIGLILHQSELADYSRPSIDAFLAKCKESLAKVDKIPTAQLGEAGRIEQEALRVHLRSMIRQIETVGAPFHDPNFYFDESVGAVQILMDRAQTDPVTRLAAIGARIDRFHDFFTTARGNLGGCSNVAVARALTRLRASRLLFERDLPPECYRLQKPDSTRQSLDKVAAGWKEVQAFTDWLEKEKLPKATPIAPLGAPGWRAWLMSREDADLSPADVVAAAQADMNRLGADFHQQLRAAATGRSIPAVLSELDSDRPDQDTAKAQATKIVGALWDWLVKERPVEPVSDIPCLVRDAPPIRRREASVRAFLPGGFGAVDEEGFLEIAPPDPEWPPALIRPWLSSLGRYFLPPACLREVYPGKYLASEYRRLSKIRVCKTIEFPTMTEGWGLCAEELGITGGAGGPEPRLKLAMLLDLIRADARLIASTRIHAMGTVPEAATIWLEREALLTKVEATAEADKLLADPDLAAPALGRLEIRALAADLLKAQGVHFSVREFHKKLLGFGSAPVSAIRRVLLPGAGGSVIGTPASGGPSTDSPATGSPGAAGPKKE